MMNAYKADPTDLYNISSIANFFSTQKEKVLELFFRLEAVKISETEQTLGMLGNCYLTNNKNNLAMVCYRKANELSNNNAAWIIGNIGNLYNNLGLYDMAVEYIKEAQNLDPTSQYLQERLSSAFTNQMKEKDEIGNNLNALNLQF
jgi:tetratricopeptide (TPR) repeat protein